MKRIVVVALVGIVAACGEAPTEPTADLVVADLLEAPSFSLVAGDPVVITSTAASTTTFEFIFEPELVSHWSKPCQGIQPFPPALNDARWGSPRPVNEFGAVHPDYIWEANTRSVAASWVFANTSLGSVGPGGQSWTRYSVDVSGLTGPATVAYAGDNCAWVHVDDVLAQNPVYFSRGSVQTAGLDLTDVDDLTFVLWDGGGYGGLKFVLNGTAGVSADSDGDGVDDGDDAFPFSDLSATVSVGSCDSGVANQVLGDGSSFMDLIGAAQASAKNHGQFVAAVTNMAVEWRRDGLISGRDHGRITSCVARSK